MVVTLWNRCSYTTTITATWPALGLESSIRVSIRDLWKVSDTFEILTWKLLKKKPFKVSLQGNASVVCVVDYSDSHFAA